MVNAVSSLGGCEGGEGVSGSKVSTRWGVTHRLVDEKGVELDEVASADIDVLKGHPWGERVRARRDSGRDWGGQTDRGRWGFAQIGGTWAA